jgi:outer membrane lipopolysaccharide assembly protein LptE/RlpB
MIRPLHGVSPLHARQRADEYQFYGRSLLKTFSRLLPLWIVLVALLAACGYHNPYVYNGPAKVIYITDWKNRTSELGLNSKIYQSLVRWFQKSGSISVTKDKKGADLILAGEITSIYLPSRAYSSNRVAAEVKLILQVRYILKDIPTGKVLLEQPSEVWTENYLISSSSSETKTNEKNALDKIIEDISQKIYQKSLVEMPKL